MGNLFSVLVDNSYLISTNSKLILTTSAVGMFTPLLTNMFMLTGYPGVNYYAEAHLTRWNSYIHTLGMPVSMYGMTLWIPALLQCTPKQASKLIFMLYSLYGGHYLYVDYRIALVYYLFYLFPVLFGIKHYRKGYNMLQDKQDRLQNNHNNFSSITLAKRHSNLFANYRSTFPLLIRGLFYSTLGLTFQEIFGHWLGGDIPSRVEAIPNAILYAKFFSLSHIF